MKLKKFNFVGTALILSALAACGGGDGGSASAPIPTPGVPPPPVVVVPPDSTASTLITSVSPSTYAASSEEAAAFNKLNAERSACGFGLLTQNTKLDIAAQGHAYWNVLNGYIGHFQIAGTPSFTGITPEDRVSSTGYADRGAFVVTDESSSAQGGGSKVGFGKQGITGLLNAPYHAAGLLSGFKDVGFSVLTSDDVPGSATRKVTVQANLAYKKAEAPQLMAGNAVATYPCEGSNGVVRLLNNESPNPVPGRDLSTLPLGSSVYIAVREGNTLVITSSSMTNLSTGVPVTMRPILNSENDPNKVNGKSYFASHQAVSTADAPLAANTRYQVVINGTNNGVAFNRNFIFTTGAGS